MDCPHCRKAFHENFRTTYIQNSGGGTLHDSHGYWRAEADVCPSYGNATIFLGAIKNIPLKGTGTRVEKVTLNLMAYPKASNRLLLQRKYPRNLQRIMPMPVWFCRRAPRRVPLSVVVVSRTL